MELTRGIVGSLRIKIPWAKLGERTGGSDDIGGVRVGETVKRGRGGEESKEEERRTRVEGGEEKKDDARQRMIKKKEEEDGKKDEQE